MQAKSPEEPRYNRRDGNDWGKRLNFIKSECHHELAPDRKRASHLVPGW
jgi:hypothetical protein